MRCSHGAPQWAARRAWFGSEAAESAGTWQLLRGRRQRLRGRRLPPQERGKGQARQAEAHRARLALGPQSPREMRLFGSCQILTNVGGLVVGCFEADVCKLRIKYQADLEL